MARITPIEIPGVDVDSLDPPQRVQLGVAGILMHRPEIAAALGPLSDAINHQGTLPRRLVELIRLRIAFHNQCRSCMAIRYEEAVQDGVTEALVCSLERPAEADDLSAAERAALRFADLFATNHLADRRRGLRRSPSLLHRRRARGDRTELCARRRDRSADRHVGRHRRPSRRVPRLVLRDRHPLERRSASRRQLTVVS